MTLIAFASGGLIGRLAYHTMQVRAGKRRFWSWELVWELPLAIFCGVVGGGLGVYLEMNILVIIGLCSALGYLGPRGVEALLDRLLERYAGGSKK